VIYSWERERERGEYIFTYCGYIIRYNIGISTFKNTYRAYSLSPYLMRMSIVLLGFVLGMSVSVVVAAVFSVIVAAILVISVVDDIVGLFLFVIIVIVCVVTVIFEKKEKYCMRKLLYLYRAIIKIKGEMIPHEILARHHGQFKIAS